MLSAQLGRFLSRDPIGYAGGAAHLYCYTLNSPAVRVDPTGQVPGEVTCLVKDIHLVDGYASWVVYLGPTVVADPDAFQCPSAGHGMIDLNATYGERPVRKQIGTLLPDELSAFSVCDNLDYAKRGCECCTPDACKRAVADFVNGVRNTWIMHIPGLGPIGWNTCGRWANACCQNLPNISTNPCVRGTRVCMISASAYGGATNIHYYFKLSLCGQVALYADNGNLGGDDHIFFSF